MLCIPIIGPTFEAAKQQVAAANRKGNLMELRLDLLHNPTFSQIETLRKEARLPLIFALRRAKELQEILQLSTLKPDYWDLEHDIPLPFLKELKEKFPAIKLIISYHDWKCTPADLDPIFHEMQNRPADLYKMATMASSTLDSLRMLLYIQQKAPFVGICMGEEGQLSRILAPLVGSPWTYAVVKEGQHSAPGQMRADELRQIYAIDSFQEGFYGLIGNPVTSSLSQYTHNHAMRALGLGALYVKMKVEAEELPPFFAAVRALRWRGLSVTMPLKEAVIPYLDQIDSEAAEIGAVNTLAFDGEKISGYNTDGKGALDAIEAHLPIHGKKIALLGAGGAARAILFEAKKRGALVTVYNRTPKKGIAEAALDQLQPTYDLLINTTPDPMPITPDSIVPHVTVMDIKTIPQMSPLLQEAQKRGCCLIYGYEMFINQAVRQFELWFPDRCQPEIVKKLMLDEINRRLIPEAQPLASPQKIGGKIYG